MKLTYRNAILSFCADLTDPDAKSLPIGTLLIGEVEESRLAAAVVFQPTGADPFATEHLSDALAIIKEHINRVLEDKPDAPSLDILQALYSALRNSLFVSAIGDEKTVELKAEMVELCGHEVTQLAANELALATTVRRCCRSVRTCST
jgi:hypothetical protein